LHRRVAAPNLQLGHPGRVPGTRELVIPKTPFIVPYRVHNEMLEILGVYPRQTSRVLRSDMKKASAPQLDFGQF
jgi:hypothetical protein